MKGNTDISALKSHSLAKNFSKYAQEMLWKILPYCPTDSEIQEILSESQEFDNLNDIAFTNNLETIADVHDFIHKNCLCLFVVKPTWHILTVPEDLLKD